MTPAERAHALEAIKKASRDPREHKVGAVLVRGRKRLKSTYGGKLGLKDHAESALLARYLDKTDIAGATLYVTLEPCTRTEHWAAARRMTCAQIIADRKIKRVVFGTRDPDPRIYGQGEVFLRKKGIRVDRFPEDLQKQCEKLNESWIRERQEKWKYNDLWKALPLRRGPRTLSFPDRLASGDAMTLVRHPDPRIGWEMARIRVDHQTTTFRIPTQYKKLYDVYLRVLYDEKRFFDDRPKVMLTTNPWVSTDTPTLLLRTKKTKFSHIQFYKDVIAATPERRSHLIDQVAKLKGGGARQRKRLVRGVRRLDRIQQDRASELIRELMVGNKRRTEFPHALCMHLVVVTRDHKILMVQRVPETAYHAYSWACSVEEHMAMSDLRPGPKGAVLRWARRALREELGLDSSAYKESSLRVLSVFLETDILNISLCCLVKLRLSREELDDHLSTLPRADEEFIRWTFSDMGVRTLIREIMWPRRDYHPTSSYRMLMALINEKGLPSRRHYKTRR